MTAAELARIIGMRGTLEQGQRDGSTLLIPVKVIDARDSFGRTDLLVEPIGGSGSAWVSADRVKVRKR